MRLEKTPITPQMRTHSTYYFVSHDQRPKPVINSGIIRLCFLSAQPQLQTNTNQYKTNPEKLPVPYCAVIYGFQIYSFNVLLLVWKRNQSTFQAIFDWHFLLYSGHFLTIQMFICSLIHKAFSEILLDQNISESLKNL